MLQYTVDWTTPHEAQWREWLGHLIGVDEVFMAELGCHEGRSSRWFIENILTGQGARLWTFDIFPFPEIAARFYRNTEGLVLNRKLSCEWCSSRGMQAFNNFDAIYIDADHKPSSVLIDACNAWQALKPGGILIFDDYRLVDMSRAVDVKTAVDSFCFAMGLTMHHSPWPTQYPDDHGQVMVKKSL